MSVDDKNEQSVMIPLDELLAQDPSLAGLRKPTGASDSMIDQDKLDRVGLSQDAHRPAAPMTGANVPLRYGDIKKKRSGKFLGVIGMLLGVVALLAVGVVIGSYFAQQIQIGGAPQPAPVPQTAPPTQATQRSTVQPPPPPSAPATAPAVAATPDASDKPEEKAQPAATPTKKAPARAKPARKSKARPKASAKAKTQAKPAPQPEPKAEAKPEPKAEAPAAPKAKGPSEGESVLARLRSGPSGSPTPDVVGGPKPDPKADLPERLNRSQILSTLRANQSSVRRCKAHVTDRTRVKMRMVIAGSGNVKSAELLEPEDKKQSKLATCMVSRVKLFKFPKFRRDSMSVKLPFIL